MKEVGFIVLLVLCMGCECHIEKPIWLNSQSPILYPNYLLKFKSKDTNWSATLVSFIQPVSLSIKYEKNGFSLYSQYNAGIIEGPAQICLSSNGHFFYYPIVLVNDTNIIKIPIDFRSPKTVNSDSSLNHQSIVYINDQFQNLKKLEDKSDYFLEKEIALDPKVKTYRAIDNIPLTSYYVQAGSCIDIPLDYQMNKANKQIEVKAGPLYDRYNNLIADGSLVRFIITDSTKTCQIETLVKNGYAEARLPSDQHQKIYIYAHMNTIKSRTIQISPNTNLPSVKNEMPIIQTKKIVSSMPIVKKTNYIKPTDTIKRKPSKTMEIY